MSGEELAERDQRGERGDGGDDPRPLRLAVDGSPDVVADQRLVVEAQRAAVGQRVERGAELRRGHRWPQVDRHEGLAQRDVGVHQRGREHDERQGVFQVVRRLEDPHQRALDARAARRSGEPLAFLCLGHGPRDHIDVVAEPEAVVVDELLRGDELVRMVGPREPTLEQARGHRARAGEGDRVAGVGVGGIVDGGEQERDRRALGDLRHRRDLRRARGPAALGHDAIGVAAHRRRVGVGSAARAAGAGGKRQHGAAGQGDDRARARVSRSTADAARFGVGSGPPSPLH